MKEISLYYAETVGNKTQKIFRQIKKVSLAYHLAQVAQHDHNCCNFGDKTRSNANIVSCDNIFMDIDNTHSEDPTQWVDIEEITKV